MSNDDISKLSATNAAQIQHLAQRLDAIGIIDLDDDSDEEVGIAFINGAVSGEMMTAIDTGTSMYWEAGTQLIEQQERPDGVWSRRLGDDGEPSENWQKAAPPPPSRAASN